MNLVYSTKTETFESTISSIATFVAVVVGAKYLLHRRRHKQSQDHVETKARDNDSKKDDAEICSTCHCPRVENTNSNNRNLFETLYQLFTNRQVNNNDRPYQWTKRQTPANSPKITSTQSLKTAASRLVSQSGGDMVDDDESSFTLGGLEQWYQNRRWKGRLSFDGGRYLTSPDDESTEKHTTHNNSVPSPEEKAAAHAQLPRNDTAPSNKMLMRMNHRSENADPDFFPFNKNWSHFDLKDTSRMRPLSIRNGTPVLSAPITAAHHAGDHDVDHNTGIGRHLEQINAATTVHESSFYANTKERHIATNTNRIGFSAAVVDGTENQDRDKVSIEDDNEDESSAASISSDDCFVWTDYPRGTKHRQEPQATVDGVDVNPTNPSASILRSTEKDKYSWSFNKPMTSLSDSLDLHENTNVNIQQTHPSRARSWESRVPQSRANHHHVVAREKYNARIMPQTLTLIRHGQSMGNEDEKLYSTVSDNAIPLTRLGWEQAQYTGRVLRSYIAKGQLAHNVAIPKPIDSTPAQMQRVHFIVSPYVRTVETFHGIAAAWCDPSEFRHIVDRDERRRAWYRRLLELGLTWHEDPRIRYDYVVREQCPAF
jgi:hypothetical protein